MADLSVEAVLLATEADEAEGATVPSKLTCHNLTASGLSKEWSIDMPDKEDIMAVCCGIGWVSSKHFTNLSQQPQKIRQIPRRNENTLSVDEKIVKKSGKLHDDGI